MKLNYNKEVFDATICKMSQTALMREDCPFQSYGNYASYMMKENACKSGVTDYSEAIRPA